MNDKLKAQSLTPNPLSREAGEGSYLQQMAIGHLLNFQ